MTLYYQDEHVTLYHGDSLSEHTEWLAADVLVTDPPYGIAYAGFGGRRGEPRRHTGRPSIAGDDTTAARDRALDLWGDRPALAFGKWNRPRPAGTRARLIWDKRPCGYLGDIALPWASVEEEIYVLGDWPALAPGGLARDGGKPSRTGNIVTSPALGSQSSSRPAHPTPKPVGLLASLIRRCPPGAIADPFAGSGSTLLAARNLGRQAIGVEVEERYCELIASQLAQNTLTLDWID